MPNPEWWNDFLYLFDKIDGQQAWGVRAEVVPKLIAAALSRRNAEILAKVEGLNRDFDCSCMVKTKSCGCMVETYNEALDEVIAVIKSK